VYFEGENKEEMGPRRSCALEFRVRTGEVLRTAMFFLAVTVCDRMQCECSGSKPFRTACTNWPTDM